jgi:hypothetical protein
MSAGPASAATHPRTGSIDLTSRCSKLSYGNLQIQREDSGRLSLDVEVDMARHTAGVPWRLKVTDNGVTILSTIARTSSDGSVSVAQPFSPKAGANHVVLFAKNPRTGETCRLSGTV